MFIAIVYKGDRKKIFFESNTMILEHKNHMPYLNAYRTSEREYIT